MTLPPDFSGKWIERDLASFADPGSTVKVQIDDDGRPTHAEWTAGDKLRETRFSVSRDGRVSAGRRDRLLKYRQFVAGPELAKLEDVARRIIQASPPKFSVATKASCENPTSATKQGPAVDIFTELLDQESDATTQVIMLTGDAGVGKTCILRELVRLQADKYIRKQTTKLLLYVNAQGRALARLDEALATELQDLKVDLTYHSIAVLTRLGILAPVIDGFDELLGVSGYDDAFGSLSGLLMQLEGRGQLIVSARSAYYEEEFLSRVGVGDQPWEHVPVHVTGWNEEDRDTYLNKWLEGKSISGKKAEEFHNLVRSKFDGRNMDLASKPLFFSRIVDLLHQSPNFSGKDDLLDELVKHYLFRERTEKLLDRNSMPLLTENQIERLMRELAEEMWNHDTRELNNRFSREIAEYVVEDEGLSEMAKKIVVERMPTFALLSSSGDSVARLLSNKNSEARTVSFEHELFFFYFLSKAIALRMNSAHGDMQIVLSRSALPDDVAGRVAMELDAGDAGAGERLREFLDRLVRASEKKWLRATQVRENAGLLAMALFRSGREIEGCEIGFVVFPGSNLADVTLSRCRFRDVTVRRTDLSSTRFLDCQAENMLFVTPRVRPETTRLELKGLRVEQVFGIHVQGDETRYSPAEVELMMIKCGAPIVQGMHSASADMLPKREDIELLTRLMTKFRHTNLLYRHNKYLAHIFKHQRWNRIERLLISHGLAAKETRHPSGKPKEILRRRFSPESLMFGLHNDTVDDARIRSFWRELAAESPQDTQPG